MGRNITNQPGSLEVAAGVQDRNSADLIDMTQVFECLPDGIRIIDKQCNVIMVNKAFTRMTGIAAAEVMSKKCYIVCNNSFCFTPLCPLVRILNGDESVETEIEVAHYDGVKVPYLMSVGPLYSIDGELIGIIESFKNIIDRKQVERGFQGINQQLKREISKRKKAEETLRLHRREYEALLKVLPVGVFYDDGTEASIVTNDFVCELFGIPKEDIDSDFWVKAIYSEDLPNVATERERCIRNKEKFCMEFRIVRSDGSLRWVLCQVVPYGGYEGEQVYFVGSVTDITHYINNQIALKESEEKLKHYIDKSPDGIFIFNEIGQFIEVNGEACTMTGYTEKELLDMTIGDFYDPKEARKVVDCLRNSEEKVTLSYDLAKADGTKVPVEIKAVSLGNGLFMSFVRDVTDRKSIEEELRKSEEQYRLIFENSPLGIFHFDLAGAITECNDKVIEILGSSREKLIGFNMLKDLKDEKMKNAVNLALTGQLGYYEDIYQSATSGKIVPLKAVFRSILAENNWLGAVAIIEDVSASKHAEEALRQSEQLLSISFNSIQDGLSVIDKDYNILRVNSTIEKWFAQEIPVVSKKCYEVFNNRAEPCQPCKCFKALESGVTSITSTKKINGKQAILEHFYFPLVGLTGQTEGVVAYFRDITDKTLIDRELSRIESLKLIGEMAASIGHEVRNPLTSVRGFLQLLHDKQELDVYGDYFNLMLNELDRANKIITDFLSFTKKHTTIKRKANLNKIVENMSVLIEANVIAENKSVRLELGNIPDIIVDKREIEQLLLNLARNGIEAMAPGGTLTIKTFEEKDEVILMVKDEGRGIKADILDKLGTPFITTKDKGTGLGLVVCNSIVERHNAVMDFKTTADGTSFFVRFKKKS